MHLHENVTRHTRPTPTSLQDVSLVSELRARAGSEFAKLEDDLARWVDACRAMTWC